MKQIKTIQFPDDSEPREIVDAKAREDIEYLKTNTIVEETDPTVPEWAKQPNKPTYNAEEVGAPRNGVKVTNSTATHIKPVHADAAPYAEVVEVGGMTRKCANLANITLQYGLWVFTENRISSNENYVCTASKIAVKPNTTYSLSGNAISAFSGNLGFFGADGAYLGSQVYVFDTFTAPENAHYFAFHVDKSYASNISGTIMLNEGSTALPYEPYFEGLRSAPVTEVESVGVNLFDLSTAVFTWSDNGKTTVEGDMLTITGSMASVRIWNLTPNHTYTFSAKSTRTGTYGGGISIESRDDSGNVISGYYHQNTLSPTITFDVHENAKYVVLFFYGSGSSDNTTNGSTYREIMLNDGSTVLPYTPYTRNTLPIHEAVQALDGYGDGVDETYFNRVNLDDQKYTQCVKRIVFDGTEDWKLRTTTTSSGKNHFAVKIGDYGFVGANRCLCDRYNYATITLTATSDGVYALNSNGYNGAFINLRDSNFSNVAEYKAQLAIWYAEGNPLTVLVVVAEPIITDISDILPADNLIGVEAGGTVRMVNEYGYDVPNNITFYEGKNEVVGADTFVGNLSGTAKRAEVALDVPAWAKQPNKPSYTAEEVGARPNYWMPTASEIGALPNTTSIPDALADLASDSTHRTVTDTEKNTWNAKSNFSGNYNDLTNKPNIPSAYTHPTSHPASMITGLSTVATSGSYNDLSNKPTIPASVTVDSALSSTSTNPVQNKVVNSALSEKLAASTFTAHTATHAPSNAQKNSDITKAEIEAKLTGTISSHSHTVSHPVTSVAGKTGAVTLAKGDVGLGNVDNTADSAKSVKYATSAGSASSATTATTVLRNVTDNKDVNIWKVYSDNDGEYGFRLQYDASGSGNNNSLSLVADNQNGTEVVAMKMLQDGTTTFAKAITASGGITGNASSATKATQDASGNTITSTYATKTELTNGLAGKAASSHGTHVSYGTSATALGTSSAGSATTVSRSDHVHALPALTSCTGTLSIAKGGTGATTVAGVLSNLGLTNVGGMNMKTGTYRGTDATVTVTLGVKPKLLLVEGAHYKYEFLDDLEDATEEDYEYAFTVKTSSASIQIASNSIQTNPGFTITSTGFNANSWKNSMYGETYKYTVFY